MGVMSSNDVEVCTEVVPTPATTADLGWALATVTRAYRRAAEGALSAIPGGPRGYQVLMMAAGSECSNQRVIAQELGLDKTVLTYLLDDLEKASLAQRQPDPADRRSRRIVLTSKGSTVLAAVTADLAAAEHELLSDLDAAEAATLRRLLATVAASASQPGESACTESG